MLQSLCSATDVVPCTPAVYCAEQINIPDNLGEVLKAYAKEVIRQQPENIYEFSARYFAQVLCTSFLAQPLPFAACPHRMPRKCPVRKSLLHASRVLGHILVTRRTKPFTHHGLCMLHALAAVPLLEYHAVFCVNF